ncbi:ABC transporter C-terminal domain-containing protein, partial [Propylenella binzhouense]
PLGPKPEAAQRAKPAPAPAAAPKPEGGRRRLSFKEKHALETLPNEIERLQGEARRLSARLAEPDFFGRDAAGFAEAAAALARAEARIAEAEEEWLRLEMLREEIEG